MIKGKKSLMVETLSRIIIMVILVFLAFYIGKKIVGTFSGSDAPQRLEVFAEEMNSLQNGEIKEAFLIMESGMAVIGFVKNTNEFRCYGCFQDRESFSEKLLYYSMKKPTNSECSEKACACLCFKGFAAGEITESGARKLSCDKTYCRTIDADISPEISLEVPIRLRKITLANYPYWENGFLFVRANDADTPSNGMNPANGERKQTVCIAKRKIGETFYAGAYPAPCINP